MTRREREGGKGERRGTAGSDDVGTDDKCDCSIAGGQQALFESASTYVVLTLRITIFYAQIESLKRTGAFARRTSARFGYRRYLLRSGTYPSNSGQYQRNGGLLLRLNWHTLLIQSYHNW